MSTMTPDKRADELADDLLDRGMVPILTREAREIIAAAIKGAQAAAVEDACKEAWDMAQRVFAEEARP